jgi:cytochrome c oxidase cbb3-type subunit 3
MKMKLFWLAMLGFTIILPWGPAQGADLDAGKSTFSQKCSKCHGDSGKGDGKVAVKMKLKMADYTNKTEMAKLTDEYLKEITLKGGKALKKDPKMPAYDQKLTEAEIDNTLAYIRSLGK